MKFIPSPKNIFLSIWNDSVDWTSNSIPHCHAVTTIIMYLLASYQLSMSLFPLSVGLLWILSFSTVVVRNESKSNNNGESSSSLQCRAIDTGKEEARGESTSGFESGSISDFYWRIRYFCYLLFGTVWERVLLPAILSRAFQKG